MSNKKNIIILLAGILILLGLITGIRYLNKNKTAQESITIAIWDSYEQDYLEDYFENFSQRENIKVNVTPIPWEEYWIAIDSSLKDGTGPDIFWMHTDMFEQYAKTGNLLSMNNIMEDAFWENFEPELLSEFEYTDQRYVIPRDISSIGLFYNKSLFDKNNLPYPTDDWTWQDLVENAKKLTSQDKEVYGFLSECWGEDGYYNTIFQNEGFIYDESTNKWGFDNPNTEEGIKFYLDFIEKHKTSPTTQEILDIDTNDLFLNDKVAMFFRGNWEILSFVSNKEFAEKFDVVELPMGKTKATVLNGTGYAASTQSKNPELVKKALQHLSEDSYYKGLASNGLSIPAHKEYRSTWVEKYSKYNSQSFIKSIKYGHFMPNLTGIPNWKEHEEEILLEIFSGDKDLHQGLVELNNFYEKGE